MKPEVKNIPASMRAKLYALAQKRKEDFQFVLTRWVAERFLYRLGESKHHDRFVLKGATLFLIWKGELARPTRDVDFLCYGSADTGRVVHTIREICSLTAADGIEFDLDKIRAEEIRDDADYGGVRVFVPAVLDKAKVTVQIDIGFGDVVDPAPVETKFPVILDLPPPSLRAYPPEVVIAEKLQAMIQLGIANSRMKDFFDIWTLSREQTFRMARLRRAIVATFEHRKTPLPESSPTALTDSFLRDPEKVKLWKAFLKRIHLPGGDAELADVGTYIWGFLKPVLGSDDTVAKGMEWPSGGPWKKLQ